jgi:hypothetical protein
MVLAYVLAISGSDPGLLTKGMQEKAAEFVKKALRSTKRHVTGVI